jgi:hypothetical protein
MIDLRDSGFTKRRGKSRERPGKGSRICARVLLLVGLEDTLVGLEDTLESDLSFLLFDFLAMVLSESHNPLVGGVVSLSTVHNKGVLC